MAGFFNGSGWFMVYGLWFIVYGCPRCPMAELVEAGGMVKLFKIVQGCSRLFKFVQVVGEVSGFTA